MTNEPHARTADCTSTSLHGAMIMHTPDSRPSRVQQPAERVWALQTAREIVFKEAKGKDRITMLILSKDTFVEAVKAIYETFDDAKLRQLRSSFTSIVSIANLLVPTRSRTAPASTVSLFRSSAPLPPIS